MNPIQNPEDIKVVLVEDDLLLQAVIAMQLEDLDVTLFTATNGYEALHLINSYHPDLLILDLTISGLDGFQVMEEIGRQPNVLETMSVVVHTCHDLTAADRHRLSAREVFFLTKSIDTENLIPFVRKILRKPSRITA